MLFIYVIIYTIITGHKYDILMLNSSPADDS